MDDAQRRSTTGFGADGAQDTAEALARSVFGWSSLRAAQRQVLEPVLAGRDTLGVIATGSGKSGVYQLAGLLSGGLTVVVSPLVALQRDQLRGLAGRSMPDGRPLRAAQLNALVHVAEQRAAEAALREGALDFLLLGPEQLTRPGTRELLSTSGRSCTMLVVDEAHLVSEWGLDFRPDYLQLADARRLLGHPQVLALTATASPPVQGEITRRLGMTDPAVVVASFDRPNISLAVHAVHGNSAADRERADVAVVQAALSGPTPALVYAATRRHCEEMAGRFRHRDVQAAPYHAGLPAAERSATQDAFLTGDLDVVVATSAFGVGIDKPDVRSVVHASPPGSLDEYYQEVGRAGRDGQPARAVLVFNPGDLRLPRMFAAAARVRDADVDAVLAVLTRTAGPLELPDLARRTGLGVRRTEKIVERLADAGAATLRAGTVIPHLDAEQAAGTVRRTHDAEQARHAVAESRIDAVRHYAETQHCRRAELLAWFGEAFTGPCGNCDNDRRPVRQLRAPLRPAGELYPGAGVDPGTRLQHRLWGAGVVLSADAHELLVVFDSVGYRHLTPSTLTNGLLHIEPAG
ncbi:ATP-dependent DNA helicase, RecQ family [Kribbella flavida DSM 17836]|uniref:ATP-dependent DNA helicase RecQ n=1 Tax=Kribbella flavida (strain DSM 17836 / JCM 10339 / NBRC 14399) TaxID=479435 RepID=D2PR94_KRIFD|nr:RecQ family ATP-dependent DNA helicase [Kribbella flavida]ADB33042.1 ATP-dependent DNA helicase, RecQ family [Kribbella flavida DSM 17836]